jgi:hypothetical protein
MTQLMNLLIIKEIKTGHTEAMDLTYCTPKWEELFKFTRDTWLNMDIPNRLQVVILLLILMGSEIGAREICCFFFWFRFGFRQ